MWDSRESSLTISTFLTVAAKTPDHNCERGQFIVNAFGGSKHKSCRISS